jgi:hypothetical protein
MNKFFILLTLTCAFVFTTNAQKVKMSSVYTNLKTECKNAFKSVNEGQDMPLVCKGFGGYKVNVGYSAWASSISISKRKSDDEVIGLASQAIDFTDYAPKLEWRLANGKPFAVILRIKKYNVDFAAANGDNPFMANNVIGEVLVIKGLAGYSQIDFEIDAKGKNANAKAQKMADENYQ